jgi:uncharacterized protein YktA (UPF0223 family)
MKTYTAWRQYEFSIEAETLEEAYDKFKELADSDGIECEYWVDDKDDEDE